MIHQNPVLIFVDLNYLSIKIWIRRVSECALAEKLGSELAKFGPKEQVQMAKTRESISEGIADFNWLNRNFQIINYNI